MRRCWFTFFLAFSLVVSIFLSDGTKIYGKDEKKTEEQAGQEDVQETQEPVNDPENAEDANPDMEEIRKQEEKPSAPRPDGSLFPSNFQDVLFIGDSRTVGLYEYGQLGEADVFADSGMSVFSLWESKADCSDGEKKTLEQLLSEKQYQTIHFMLGINELGYPMEQIVQEYEEAVEKIQDMQPQAIVVLGANMHVTAEKSESSSIYNNERINILNDQIKQIGQEQNCYYIDVNERFDDEEGSLSEEYSGDGSHVLGKYYAEWTVWLQGTRTQ